MSHPPAAARTAPRPPARPRPAAKPKPEKWGWLEWFLIAQGFLPALLFIPGISSGRVVIKIVQMLLPMAAWAQVVQAGRAEAGPRPFPARAWLTAVSAYLVLLVFHWNTNSPLAGIAHAMLYIAVYSPAFWVSKVLKSPRQVTRLMAILLICNGLSTLVGIGQVFRPATFNPPVIPGITDSAEDSIARGSLIYKDQDGREIIRPCGLSDQVGAAAGAGVFTALIGLAFALRPIGNLKRLICLGLAFCGVAVIYYSQVRTTMVMLVISLAVLVATFAAQRNFAHATLLGGLGAAMIVGAFSWVAATSGDVVVKRFLGLMDADVATTFENSGRSGYVRHALEVQMWSDPVGIGLGWWTMAYTIFGDKSVPNTIWIEVMVPGWVYDGGIPLLFMYVGALVAAMGSTLHVALKTRDRELAFWAAVTASANLCVLATCISYVTFVTSFGVQFWLLASVIHAADARARAAVARSAAPRPGPPPPRPEPQPQPTGRPPVPA